MLFMLRKKNYPSYVSKHNSILIITQLITQNIIFLMIPNREGWHYLAVKKLSALLKGITSEHHGDFYCLNCLHSFATEKKLESHKTCMKIKIFVIQLCLLKTLKYWNLTNIENLIKHHLLFNQILYV